MSEARNSNADKQARLAGCTCTWVNILGDDHRFYSPACPVHIEGRSEARPINDQQKVNEP